MSKNLTVLEDCVREAAVSFIQESYASEWNEDSLISRFDADELFAGLDDSTSNKEEDSVPPSSSIKTGSSLHYCDCCEYSSSLSYNLKRHMLRAHLNIYSVQCDQCNQQFKDGDTLRRHQIQVHTIGTTLFRCTRCGKSFKRRHDLKRHDQTVHVKQKMFICPYCASSFGSSSNCQRHLKYRCELRPLTKQDGGHQ